jgi:diaminopimelate decarboxylase
MVEKLMLWPRSVERDNMGELTIGGLRATDLAAEYGTPLYVFDEAELRGRIAAIKTAFAAAYDPVRVIFAGKAFLNIHLLQIFREEGLGLDVVSGGELYAGLKAGIDPAAITFHGNNKSETELREAIEAGVGSIAVDNFDELEILRDLTSSRENRVPVMLRVNPGVDVHTHDKIKTGVTDSKFGFPIWTGDAARAVETAVGIPGLDLIGYHAHLGSQLFDEETMAVAIDEIVAFAAEMNAAHGVVPKVISPGGGFGIAYLSGESDADLNAWAKRIGDAMNAATERHGLPRPLLTVEPGRSIVGPAAITLYRVGASKEIPGVRKYVSVDGGMADNIRPTLYGARYTAEIANRAASGPTETVTIAGKYCESGDILIDGIDLPKLERDDLLAVPATGAYCLSMASNYNHSPRPAVVLVSDGKSRLIRRRETYADLIASEIGLE